MKIVGITALVAVLVGALSTSSRAQAGRDLSANAHLKRGLDRYAARDYEGAIAEFKAGYEVEPRRDFLFALGQAERLSGDCRSAIIYYKRFLARTPNERQREAAWENLRRCRRALQSGPGERPPSAAQLVDDKPPPPAPAKPKRRRLPWYKDVAGGALLSAGAIALALGGGFLSSAGSAESRAGRATTYDQYARYMDMAGSRRSIGVATIAAGGALLAGAVYRYIKRRGAAGETIGVSTSTNGIALSIGGSF